MDRDPISTPTPLPADQKFDDAWREHNGYLLGLASKMLGDPVGAEDIVQEAFGRLAQVELEEIQDVRAWLVVVVRRLCLNRISSAYSRRESVAGAAPPEQGLPLPDWQGRGPSGDPADRITLDGQVQLALAVVLDRLTPAERTSFVLHDVFGFPYGVIGEIVGRTSTACRQLASRARRSIRAPSPSTPPETADIGVDEVDQHSILVERFIAACSGGDIAGLLAVLDPDAVGEATLLGVGPAPEVKGAHEVATTALRYLGPGVRCHLVPVPLEGRLGVVGIVDGHVLAILELHETEGVIDHIRAFVRLPNRPFTRR